jgi:hypothetical protein
MSMETLLWIVLVILGSQALLLAVVVCLLVEIQVDRREQRKWRSF